MFQNNKSLSKFNYNNFLKFFFYFLIFILPFITISNDQKTVFRLLIFQIIFIIILLFKKKFIDLIKKSISNNKAVIIIFSLFLLSITFSYTSSPSKIQDWGFSYVRVKYLESIVYIFFFLFMFLFLKLFQIEIKKFSNIVLISSILYVALIYAQGFLVSNYHLYKFIKLFSETRGPGMILTSNISLCIAFYTLKDFKKINYKSVLILSFLISLIFFFGGRGNLLSVLIVCFLSIVYKKNVLSQNVNIFLKTLLLAFLLGYFIFKLFVFLYIFTDSQNANTLEYQYNLIRTNYLDRLEVWATSLRILKESVLFGHGPNIFYILQINGLISIQAPGIGTGTIIVHPHNFILQFLIEWGLVGTLLILFLMTKNILKGIIILIKKRNKYLIIPVLNIAGLTAHGLVDGTYIHPVTVTFLLISNAMIAANVKFK